MGNNLYEFILKARDDASKTFQKVKQAAKDMEESYNKSNQTMINQSKQFALAMGAVGAAAVALAGKLAIDAAQNDRTRQTFAALGDSIGLTGDAMEQMRAATNGLVSDVDIMKSGNKLMAMGLADSQDQMASLMNVATRLGAAMGTGPTESMENFALMLANQSIPRLDTFGISSGRVREQMEKLQKANKGMSRETAFMQATMEEATKTMDKLGTFVATDGEKLQMLQIRLQNAADRFGKMLIPALQAVIPLIESMASAVENMLVMDWGKWLQENQVIIGIVAGALASLLVPAIHAATLAVYGFVLAWGPFLAIGAAVGAAVVALKNAWDTNFFGMRDTIIAVFNNISNFISGSVEHIKNMIMLLVNVVTGDFGAAFGNLETMVGNYMTNITGLVGNGLQMIVDQFDTYLLGGAISRMTTMYDMMTGKHGEAMQTMAQQSEQLMQAKDRLGEEELNNRLTLVGKIVAEDYKGIQERLSNEQMSLSDMIGLFSEKVSAHKVALDQELAYDGKITTAQLKLLDQWGQNNIEMRQLVTQVDFNEMSNRLKIAKDFGVNDAKLVSELVNYKAEMGNEELKAYAQKLSHQEKAAVKLKSALAKIFSKPILQEIKFVGDNIAQRLVSGLSSLGDYTTRVSNEVEAVMNDYNATISVANKEFETTVGKLVKAGSDGAEKLSGSGGAAADAVDKVTDSLKEQDKMISDLTGAYGNASESIRSSLIGLSSQHKSSIQGYAKDIDGLNTKITELRQNFEGFINSQAKGLGDELYKQQKTIADLKTEINKGIKDGDKENVKKLKEQLKKEEEILKAHGGFFLQNEEDLQKNIASMREKYAKQSEALANATTIQEKAAAQVKLNQMATGLQYMENIEKNFGAEQTKIYEAMEEAKAKASMSDLELYMYNIQQKRNEQEAALQKELADVEDKIKKVQDIAQREIAVYQNKVMEIENINALLTREHGNMLANQVAMTRDAVSQQIAYYQQLAQVSGGAGNANFSTLPSTSASFARSSVSNSSVSNTSNTSNTSLNMTIVAAPGQSTQDIATQVKNELTRELQLNQLGAIR